MLSRIEQIKKEYGFTAADVSRVSGISINTINKQLQGVYTMKVDTLAAIIKLCPGVDANWVLTGEKKTDISGIGIRLERIENMLKNMQSG